MQVVRGSNWRYLAQEAVLIIVGSYVLLLGGTAFGSAVPAVTWVTVCVVGLVGLTWLGWVVVRRQPVEPLPVWPWLAAAGVAYAITSLTSTDPRRSLTSISLMLLGIWPLFVVHDLVRHGWPTELFVKVLLVVGSIPIGFTGWQLVRWEQEWLSIAGWETPLPPIWLRPGPIALHANQAAALVNLVWPLGLAWLCRTRSWPARVWCGLLMMGSGIALLFFSSRGALLGTAGATIVFVFLAVDWRGSAVMRVRQMLQRRWWSVGLGCAILILGVGTVGSRLLAHPTHGSISGSRTMFWDVARATFLESPFVGTGLGTFVSNYLRRRSVPPDTLYSHAHSVPYQVAAEGGVLGLAALIGLIAAIVATAWRRWRTAGGARRALIAGWCAALTTLAVHSLVETPTVAPTIVMVGAVWLALLLAEPGGRSVRGWERLIGGVLGAMTIVGVVVGGGWTRWGYTPRTTAAWGAETWEEALPQLEAATRRDPGHAHLRFQAGFAYGMSAAEGEAECLDAAIAHYRAGIEREPYYSLNHANLGVLLWERGDEEEATAAMERAAELAPREAAYPLNVGVYYEAQAMEERAMAAYERALRLRPEWGAAYFWRATETRQTAHARWRAGEGNGTEDVGETAEAALARFESRLSEKPSSAAAHLGRGRALMELERWEEASGRSGWRTSAREEVGRHRRRR
ncbi:MAG: hypothetical protein GX601_12800 [Anaerolineales bacterium]|nr:hypothetical protein [Anaerolineales bacterium]